MPEILVDLIFHGPEAFSCKAFRNAAVVRLLQVSETPQMGASGSPEV